MIEAAVVWLRSYNLLIAWIVALIGTVGSLLAEFAFGFTPCMMCWYQRVFLYPLVILLGVATYRDDRKARAYILPLSILGCCFALYHYLEQNIPALKDTIRCTTDVPCSGHYIDWLGFITIPLLSLVGFLVITLLLLLNEDS